MPRTEPPFGIFNEAWQKVMAEAMLEKMAFRLFMGDGFGNTNATSSADLPAKTVRNDVPLGGRYAAIYPEDNCLFKKQEYVVVETESPIGELVIEGEYKTLIDEASQIPDEVWQRVEAAILRKP